MVKNIDDIGVIVLLVLFSIYVILNSIECVRTVKLRKKEHKQFMQKYYCDNWIPCSERLPEMFCTVLITAKLPEDKESLVYEGARTGKRWELAGVANPEDYIVSAWQPLPEPWEGENE